jgi:membrane protein DedA with SNARE-associated domain
LPADGHGCHNRIMTATEPLIANYGLLAVFIGGILEGETVFVLAAIAAQHGLLSLPLVFAVGAAGAFVGDQAWFMLARRRARFSLLERLMARPRMQKALALVERRPTVFILSFRFVYGMRTLGAVACGLSRIPAARFFVLNLAAALLWTAVILSLGYLFGHAMEAVFGEVKRIEWKLLAGAIVVVLLFFAIRRVERKWLR